jgi:two-component system sensor histidine kinase SenX3
MTFFVLGLAAGLAAGSAVLFVTRARARQRLRVVASTLGEPTGGQMAFGEALAVIERAARRVQLHDAAITRCELRLELALSSMTQGAVICDERGDIVLRNEFARSFVDARHGDALVEAAIRELLDEARDGETADREVEVHDNPPRTFFVHASPLHDGVDLLGAIATVDDITDQQRIDAVRRDFVANISHELKTPVGALALLAETIADESDPEVVDRLVGRMRDESFRVARVIDDLLALSHIEGEGAQQIDRIEVASLLDDALARIRPAAENRHIAFQVSDVDATLALYGDRRQLTSALYNLLENAVKYSDDGSTVQVRAAGDGDEVSLVVQDHGIGIPARDLERIFERFYRVDRARSRATGGTGLGLAIVRHVARNHGGSVSVSSREGAGSTFMLVLPTGLGLGAGRVDGPSEVAQ